MTTNNLTNNDMYKFNELVKRDYVKLTTDLVETRIKPKYLLKLNMKRALHNFSGKVREWKYNQMLKIFKHILKWSSEKNTFVYDILEELKEALNKEKFTIPKGYDNYELTVSFDNNRYINNMIGHLFKDCDFIYRNYLTPTEYKKFVLREAEEKLENFTNEYFMECFEKAYNHRDIYFRNNQSNIISTKYNIKFGKEINSDTFTNRINNSLCRSFMNNEGVYIPEHRHFIDMD